MRLKVSYHLPDQVAQATIKRKSDRYPLFTGTLEHVRSELDRLKANGWQYADLIVAFDLGTPFPLDCPAQEFVTGSNRENRTVYFTQTLFQPA